MIFGGTTADNIAMRRSDSRHTARDEQQASLAPRAETCSGGKRFRVGDVKDGQLCAPHVVRRVLEEQGWRETTSDADWHLFWKSGRFTVGEYDRRRGAHQRLNHFAKSGKLCCKDSLVRVMRCCKATHGSAFDFVPESYLLPNEYNKFMRAYSASRDLDRETLWICKPSDLSRGKKIFIMKDIRELVYDCSTVIQRYMHQPMLIGGYKFDLRVYVLVTSCHPLRIHLFQDGLCRFGTQPYSNDTYQDIFAHLTNYAINKDSPTYADVKDVIGSNNKWTLRTLYDYLRRAQGVDVERVLRKMKSLIVLTLLALPGIVPQQSSGTCFELFGFDIILDAKSKPWLLEINTSPALNIDTYEDEEVKVPLIRDLISAVGFGQVEGGGGGAGGGRVGTGGASKRLPSWQAHKRAGACDAFEPHHHGQFEQIFPFNDTTHALAGKLARQEGTGENTAAIKQVIAELRAWSKAASREAKAAAKAKDAASGAGNAQPQPGKLVPTTRVR